MQEKRKALRNQKSPGSLPQELAAPATVDLLQQGPLPLRVLNPERAVAGKRARNQRVATVSDPLLADDWAAELMVDTLLF